MPDDGVGIPIVGSGESQIRAAMLRRKVVAVTEVCDRDQGDELYIGFDNGMIVRLRSPERIRIDLVERMPDE